MDSDDEMGELPPSSFSRGWPVLGSVEASVAIHDGMASENSSSRTNSKREAYEIFQKLSGSRMATNVSIFDLQDQVLRQPAQE